STPSYHFFFIYCDRDHPNLHSFPTRRSSDLVHKMRWYDDRNVAITTSGDEHSEVARLQPRAPLVVALRGVPRMDEHQVRSRCASDRKSTRLNSSHVAISYAVFCLKKKKKQER